MDALQFSFAMNFDDESLWLKLYQALIFELGKRQIALKDMMKLLSILENISAPVDENENEENYSMFSKDQLHSLRTNAIESISKILTNSDNSDSAGDLSNPELINLL